MALLKIGVSAKGILIELARQYFSKGTDFNNVSEEKIQHVMDRLNRWPQKIRG